MIGKYAVPLASRAFYYSVHSSGMDICCDFYDCELKRFKIILFMIACHVFGKIGSNFKVCVYKGNYYLSKNKQFFLT